jgi:lipopolysaccharide/colanic/teichoic acid biosynthesis glycosyltransferase
MMVEQQPLYPGRAYFKLRPGITGNWQVSDRNETSFAARAGFDDYYEANLGFWMDLDILARTAGVVLRCTGR